eukprot:scaffold1628_cov407-Prasinococcus_capsulatus_cf.AAC.26
MHARRARQRLARHRPPTKRVATGVVGPRDKARCRPIVALPQQAPYWESETPYFVNLSGQSQPTARRDVVHVVYFVRGIPNSTTNSNVTERHVALRSNRRLHTSLQKPPQPPEGLGVLFDVLLQAARAVVRVRIAETFAYRARTIAACSCLRSLTSCFFTSAWGSIASPSYFRYTQGVVLVCWEGAVCSDSSSAYPPPPLPAAGVY